MKTIKKSSMVSIVVVLVSLSTLWRADGLSEADAGLFDAVDRDDLTAASRALHEGADVNAWRNKLKTPLFLAKSTEMAYFLFANRARVNEQNKYKQTPLFGAQTNAVVDLLVREGAEVNARDHHKTTPLFHAQTADVAQELLKQGADINAQDIRGKTPLWTVVEYCSGAADRGEVRRYMELIDVLLQRGADTELENKAGFTIMGDLLQPFLLEPIAKELSIQMSQVPPRHFFVQPERNITSVLVVKLIRAGAGIPFSLMNIEPKMRELITQVQQERNSYDNVPSVARPRRRILRTKEDYDRVAGRKEEEARARE